MKNKNLIDIHTHTIVSGHAYNTMNEMIRAAVEKGLILLGISEHGPAMLGSTNKFYFQNMGILSREKYGIPVMHGVEFNIIDLKGNVDLDEKSCENLDYAIASLHYNCMAPGNEKENTYALITAMQHPKVRIIGHPDDGHFPMDYKTLVREAKERNVLLELNNSSFNPKGFRMKARENNIELLELCATEGVSIILGSDAHREEDVGEFSEAEKLLSYVEFPEELVVNQSMERFRKWFPIPQEEGGCL